MASGELRTGTERRVEPGVSADFPSDTVTAPGGDLGPAANAGAGQDLAASRDSAVSDRSEVVVGRKPGPFTPRQLSRLDEALTLSSRETGLDFSIWVGALDEPTREHAERLHSRPAASGRGRADRGLAAAAGAAHRHRRAVDPPASGPGLLARGAVDAGVAVGR